MGDVRKLSYQEKEVVAQKVDKYATLRNTPAFYKLRRTELEAMIEQLGDPHVFATNSHADTYCPSLQRFIMASAVGRGGLCQGERQHAGRVQRRLRPF